MRPRLTRYSHIWRRVNQSERGGVGASGGSGCADGDDGDVSVMLIPGTTLFFIARMNGCIRSQCSLATGRLATSGIMEVYIKVVLGSQVTHRVQGEIHQL